ncbi:hypothetical protein BCR35DRAFT_301242 [Leucosporidium creatinivorum]|uniref:Uncharacterized protein n=1 Tax=Leucosporidium creatinivorum TaxID=106004 RepID=A0A1Y2G1U0_9BASI|nr:hypothetical protein BCR35DRAFT_301242 [Leucosporidium creatinivorum]
MLLREGDPEMLEDMRISHDGTMSTYHTPTSNGDSSIKAIRDMAWLFWQGTVATLNAEGQEELRDRLCSMIPCSSESAGFTREDITAPSKVSDKTLDSLCEVLYINLVRLVDSRLLLMWRSLSAMKMDVEDAGGGSRRM